MGVREARKLRVALLKLVIVKSWGGMCGCDTSCPERDTNLPQPSQAGSNFWASDLHPGQTCLEGNLEEMSFPHLLGWLLAMALWLGQWKTFLLMVTTLDLERSNQPNPAYISVPHWKMEKLLNFPILGQTAFRPVLIIKITYATCILALQNKRGSWRLSGRYWLRCPLQERHKNPTGSLLFTFQK